MELTFYSMCLEFVVLGLLWYVVCPVVGIVGWTGLVSVSLSLCFLSLSLSLALSFLSSCLDFCPCLSIPLSLSLSRSISLALFRCLYLSLAAYSGADPAADDRSVEVCGLAPGVRHCLERRRDVGG